jgi:hypothetical protein
MLNPTRRGRERIQQFGGHGVADGDCGRVESPCRSGRNSVDRAGRFLAATVGRSHVHLLALIVRRAAARTFLSIHLCAGEHAGHYWRQE